MPKRLIHTGIWESYQFNQLSDIAKLLYIGMITFGDDDGRLMAIPVFLKSKIFPLAENINNKIVSECLNEIIKSKLVIAYTVEDILYAQHPKWRSYQSLRNSRYKKSKFPEPPSENTVQEAQDDKCDQGTTVGRPMDDQTATKRQPMDDQGTTVGRGNITKHNITKHNNKPKGLGDKSPATFGDPNINSFLEIIKTETGRPATAGQQSRRYASNFLKNLKKQYPDQNPLDGARAIIRAAMSFDNPWHPTKAHDPQHLFYKWQEIVAQYQFKKSPNSANDSRTEEQKRSDDRLRDMREQTK